MGYFARKSIIVSETSGKNMSMKIGGKLCDFKWKIKYHETENYHKYQYHREIFYHCLIEKLPMENRDK